MPVHRAKPIILLCLLLALTGALAPRVTTAATYTVSPGGPETLAAAIRRLAPGDTLYLKGGVYSQGIDANDFSPFPSGTSWSNAVTIAAAPGDTAVIPQLNLPQASIQYVIFDGVTIDADQQGATATAYSIFGSHVRFQNGEIRNGHGQGVQVGGDGNEFLNSRIHHNGTDPDLAHGIYLSGTNHLIDGCEFYANAAYGIHVYQSGGSGTDGNIVRNNRSHDNHHGAVVGSGEGNMAYNNLIYNNRDIGLQVSSGAIGTKVYNNTIVGNGGDGLFLRGGAVGTIIRNNIVFGNGAVLNDQGGGGTTQSNNLTTAPGLAPDFTLQAGSAAIGAGVTLAEVVVDIRGTRRGQGRGYDIGAFEYGSTGGPPAAGHAAAGATQFEGPHGGAMRRGPQRSRASPAEAEAALPVGH